MIDVYSMFGIGIGTQVFVSSSKIISNIANAKLSEALFYRIANTSFKSTKAQPCISRYR